MTPTITELPPGKIIEGRGGSGSEIDKESEREKREKR